MNHRLAYLAIVTAISLLAPVSTWAQQGSPPPVAGPRIVPVQPPLVVSSLRADSIVLAGDRKDPLLAGMLSYLLPGLGSFYAGNSRHGVRHLVIFVPAAALLLKGYASCDPYFGTGCSDGGALAAGAVVLGVDVVWAIVTAVGDARAHNRFEGSVRPGRVVGSLYVEPSIVGLSHSGAPSRALQPAESAGLQLLRIEF